MSAISHSIRFPTWEQFCSSLRNVSGYGYGGELAYFIGEHHYGIKVCCARRKGDDFTDSVSEVYPISEEGYKLSCKFIIKSWESWIKNEQNI